MAIEAEIKKTLGDFKLDIQFASKARRIGILGASGSGKSMILRCIAGFETPDQGSIRLEGNTVYDSLKKHNITPQKRRIGYLFQNYALFPTMTAAQNIGAGCRGTRAEKKRRVAQMLEKFQLSTLADRLPGELSGGQQQRVALARIMAYQPYAVLLDEPFSAMDLFLKDQMQREMQEMLADYPGTVLFVSHSRDEIYRFCEELVVIDQGKTVIQGETKELFERPVYLEAARLTGCKNFSAIQRLDRHTIRAADWGITLHLKNEAPQEAAYIGFRAHDFVPVWGERKENCLRATLAGQAQLPFEQNYYLQPECDACGAQPVCWFVQRSSLPAISRRGMPDFLYLPEDKILFLREAFANGQF